MLACSLGICTSRTFTESDYNRVLNNWQQADGVVTVKYPGNDDIIVKMDAYGSSKNMCAIALLENVGGDTLSIQKQVQFFDGHRQMDQAYNWSLRWVTGKK